MSRRQELLAYLTHAGDLLSGIPPAASRDELTAAWREQTAAALAAAHLDDELAAWQRSRSEHASASPRDALERGLDLLRGWQEPEETD